MSLRIVRVETVDDARKVVVQFPGPQGPGYGNTASYPFTTIYIQCHDNTIHAVSCELSQGIYTLRVNQTDSTP